LSLKNFILRSSKSGGCQDDFSGLVSSFKLPHNGCADRGRLWRLWFERC
jgi:hypothetical protein